MNGLGRVGALLILLVVTGACATPRGAPGAMADAKPGERPALDTDEAGLWMQMDRLEQQIKSSGHLVRDPELNAYLRDVVCRLAGPHCPGIRVYLLRNPLFNASMAPNGMMQVYTGLLLRMDNEAQLVYVLGHEVGHFVRRHSLQIWRDVRAKAAFLSVFQVMVSAAGAGAGAGGIGGAAQLGNAANVVAGMATLGSVYAFSRDSEREADELGFELMLNASYDPREAPKTWSRLLKERDAAKESTPVIFFATHPPTAERMATLTEMGQKAEGRLREVRREELLAQTLRHRATWLGDEMRRRQFASAQVLLDHLLEEGVRPGELHFFQGELYRLRGDKDDAPRAITAYRRALEFADTPPESHRNLALVLLRTGDRTAARLAFQQYLEVQPAASDAEMIRDQLRSLE